MMSPALLLLVDGSIKKRVYCVFAVLLLTLILPIVSVFALGTHTLSFLLHSASADLGNSRIIMQTQGLYQGSLDLKDRYEWGNCTYWASLLREQADDPIPQNWGNAATWAYYATLAGYEVDHNPSPGSIMQISNVDGGLGHVAYVTAVDSKIGTWTISEMNVLGLDIVDAKTLPISMALNYNFIHDAIQYPGTLGRS